MADRAEGFPVRIRHQALSKYRHAGWSEPARVSGRRRGRRSGRRRPSGRRGLRPWPGGPVALLPQQRGCHVFRTDPRGWTDGRNRWPEHDPGRL